MRVHFFGDEGKFHFGLGSVQFRDRVYSIRVRVSSLRALRSEPRKPPQPKKYLAVSFLKISTAKKNFWLCHFLKPPQPKISFGCGKVEISLWLWNLYGLSTSVFFEYRKVACSLYVPQNVSILGWFTLELGWYSILRKFALHL